MKIKIKRLKSDAILPKYAHPDDAGMDLYSLEDYELQVGERHDFGLGFALEIPNDYASLIWDKSGLAIGRGLHCLGGVIDAGYRGEYTVILANFGQESYKIKKGDKIAQLLIQPVMRCELEEVDELSETARAQGAFGSTGKSIYHENK